MHRNEEEIIIKINFSVRGDKLSFTGKEKVNSGSLNYYLCGFSFDSEWKGITAMAIFRRDDEHIGPMLITDGVCLIPTEMVKKSGLFEIGVYGSNSDMRIATNWCKIEVADGAYTETATAPDEPQPDVWESYMLYLSETLENSVPRINESGNWEFWNTEKKVYTDSGKPSRGIEGEKGDKGDKGDIGERGKKGDRGDTGERGEKGEKGERGNDGYTPIKGKDYFTDADILSLGIDKKVDKEIAIPHTIAFGNPVFIGDRLSGEKLISIKVYGANGGVGDLQDDGSYKTSLSVSAKNMFNPEFLKVTTGGVYGYYKMIDTNEDLVMSLRVKDESVTLPDGAAVMFTYRGYDAKYQDDGQAEYLVPIWINNRHMGEYVLNEKNGICLKYLSFYPNSKSTIEAIKAKFDIQIERGNVATELEPYIPPVEVSVSTPLPINKGETVNITDFDIPESDAYTISSATVVSPSKIEVEYYQDINKVISELKNAILAQGGNV